MFCIILTVSLIRNLAHIKKAMKRVLLHGPEKGRGVCPRPGFFKLTIESMGASRQQAAPKEESRKQ